MATEVATASTPGTQLDEMQTLFPYRAWQQREGIGRVEGYYVEDLGTLPLKPWARKGTLGTFVNLEGTGGVNDLQLIELAPGSTSSPDRHLFEALVYAVSGSGSASVWYDEGNKQTFEWGAGSLFAIPLNANYRFFNASGVRPARLAMVTNAPTVMNLFHSDEFIFDNPFAFRDRFSSEAGFNYFDGSGKLWKRARTHVWETNFVRDVRTVELHSWSARGANGRNVMFELAHNSTSAHVSEFPVGTYKKAHRHGPGAHVIILYGTGFSTLWREGEEPVRCDWKPNSVVVPPNNWFHQHFNTGAQPASYLALKFQGRRYSQNEQTQDGVDRADVSVKLGGNQMEYEDEDPSVHQTFESELSANGAKCRMKGLVEWCTSDEVPPTLGSRG